MDPNANLQKEAQTTTQAVFPPKPKPGRMALQVFAILVMLGLVGWGAYAWQNNRVAELEKQVTQLKNEAATESKANDPYADWKTYSSKTEKSTFKYPSRWMLSSKAGTNIEGADMALLTSPGGLKIEWYSVVDGLGGGCDEDLPISSGSGCPLVEVISKAPLAGATTLYVVSGVITRNGSAYSPWIAIQDAQGNIKNGRGMAYAQFTGLHNASTIPELNGKNAPAMLNVGGGFYLGEGLPKGSKADAVAQLNSEEMKTAKKILESYSY